MEIYDFKIKTLDGKDFDFSEFRGKKMLIVNVASACGFTPQYVQLQELHQQFGQKLSVIGIPCNDFGGQESGTADEIADFCQLNYGVEFRMTEKMKILGNPSPLYDWLTKAEHNEGSEIEVSWNFCKFLINNDGTIHSFLPSAISPLDEEILNWVSQ